MFKNYLTIALRNLKRHKLFSIINILCLSLGITFSMLIGVYIIQEKNVNHELHNSGNQYFVKSKWKTKNAGLDITTLGPLPKAMKEDYPNLVANYYRYNPVTNVVSAGDSHFKEDISIGDTGFISMYNFPLLHGNKQQPFLDNNSAVITASMAIKLFGKTDAVDQRISIQTLNNEKQDYIVSAVLKDIPHNSVTGIIGDSYSVYVPTEGNRYYQGGDPSVSWNSVYEVGFVELKDGVKPSDLVIPFRNTLAKYAPANIKDNLEVELVSVKDYYLRDNNGAVQKMILVLAIIGAFILLMAVINFVNISFGTSSYRLKEIGLRKVFGGAKRQLIFQFLSESVLLSIIAGLISLLCYSLLRPVFNQLLGTSIETVQQFAFSGIIVFIGFLLLIGIISGLYPAFVLSSSTVSLSVKGKMESAGSRSILRKSLLIVQFTLTIVVFIGAMTVSRQVSHVFSKDLGYNKEQLMVITAFPKQWDSTGVLRMEGIKQQLLQLPAVKSATLAFEIPDRKPPATMSLLPVDGKASQPINIPTINVDDDYAATYEMKMIAGNFFSHDKGGFISGRVVLNESAAKALGLDVQSAVGRQINFPPGVAGPLTVVGIVNDYNYSNIQEGIEPLAFMHVRDFLSYRYLTLRLKPGNMGEAIATVKTKWKDASPNAPFEYYFMDDKFRSLYKSELQLKKASQVATVLNLLIVLMGVFGVVTFTLVKRNKEIAIRKVLGANAREVIRLFLKEYGITILIANFIAWPVAWLVLDNWLRNYNYRVQQNIGSYLIVGMLVFFLAFVMIIGQCFKIATTNPVKSLRTE